MPTIRSFEYFDGNEVKRASDSLALYKTLLDKVREAFDIKGVENGGLTQNETWELLKHFLKSEKVW